jgi:anti-sigma factor RsiW
MTRSAPAGMACVELVELASEYFDGALPVEERERLEGHLASCSACIEYLRQLRDTTRVARRIALEAVPAGAQERMLAAFREWKQARS